MELICFLLTFWTFASFQQTTEPFSLNVPLMLLDRAWRTPEGASAPTAPAELLLLEENGTMIYHACWLIKKKGRVYISVGDSHGIATGSWKREGNQVLLIPRFIYRDLRPLSPGGKELPDPLCKGIRLTIKKGKIESQNGRFKFEKSLDVQQLRDWGKSAEFAGTRCGGA